MEKPYTKTSQKPNNKEQWILGWQHDVNSGPNSARTVFISQVETGRFSYKVKTNATRDYLQPFTQY